MIRTPQKEEVFWMWGRYGRASSIRAAASAWLGQPGNWVKPCPGRATRRIEVADDHMVEQEVVQTPRGQLPADQVRVDIQDRHFGERRLKLCVHRMPLSIAEASS